MGNSIGKGIATVGIWAASAYIATEVEGAATGVIIFATITTVLIWLFSD